MKKKIPVGVMFLASLVISQCKLPSREYSNDTTGSSYFVQVTNPGNGAVLAVGDHATISVRLFDIQEGVDSALVNRLIFYANGQRFDETQAALIPSSRPLDTVIEWNPVESGEYFLQVSGSRPGRWSISEPVRVCVLDFSLETPELYDVGGYAGTLGYEGECEIPARSTGARSGPLTFSPVAFPDQLSYFPGLWDPISSSYYSSSDAPPEVCRDLPAAITFIVSAGDPGDDIAFVKVDVSYDFNGFTSSATLILNRTSGSVLEPKIFTGESLPPRSFSAVELNETFDVIWTAYAIGRSGEILASDGPNRIPVEPCIFEEMVPLDAPIPEPPAEPPPLEPSEENCPPGTYYAPVTNRCIEIQIPSSSGGEGDSEGGACNLSSAACSAQGYSFDENKCECVPIQ